MYVEELKKSDVTRAVIFATMHVEGTKILMELLENSGLSAYVGKVNMDRNGGKDLEEKSAEKIAGRNEKMACRDGRPFPTCQTDFDTAVYSFLHR